MIPKVRQAGAAILVVLAAGVCAVPASAATGSVAYSGYDPRPGVPTGLTATVTVDQVASEPTGSQLRGLRLSLPQGLELGPQMSTGGGALQLCSATAFAVHAAVAGDCSLATRIGDVSITAPSQPRPLTGAVFLGVPASGGLPSLYLEAALDGSADATAPRMKLVGNLVSEADGHLAVDFDEVPAPPISGLQLTLAGGERAILGTPPACGSSAGLATFTAASTGSVTAAAGAISINQDCSLPGFAPSFGIAAGTPQAGAAGTTSIGISRADRSPRLAGVHASLPTGLLANIGAVPECQLSGAAAAGCPAPSRIGSVSIAAGLGDGGRTWTGSLYLAPRAPGAVAGAWAVVHMVLGELDLGWFAFPVRVDLRPADAGLDLSFDVPSRAAGLPLDVRNVTIAVDRPDFAVNPSSCGPLAATFAATGDGGQSAGGTAQVAYAGCTALNFAPTLKASLTGEVEPLGHPNVSVELNARAGDTNLAGAIVTLPTGVAADLANLTNVCPRQTFDAVACSAAQRVGTATATIGLTPEPIPGDVYLIKVAGETLPGLGLSFTGRYSQRVVSTVRIAADGRLQARFDGIPDLPLRSLHLDITGGARGPIRLAPTACADGAVWDATFTGQGGQASSHTIPAPCPVRPAKKSAITLSSITGLSWRIPDLGGRILQSAKLTLPAGFALRPSRARLKQYQSVRVATGASKVTISSRAIIVRPRTKITRSLAVKLRSGTVTSAKKVTARTPLRRVKVKVRLGFSDGSVQNQTVTLRAR